ncbi:glycosyltransferase [Streptomyces jumonjinensis]|uniref:Glycosyltransferase n=1 Tax=Streptomyces jumonjinensis TaxID=1945 RepID=A0A646KMT8_STRJU|nr:glycosyltransferase [Streptomyces jumonjinensis]MQT03357.1 glycosyltransferase [Streptomyces jumonjinensis]
MPTALFAWRRTPPPFLIGGAEVTQQLLAEELAAAGWHVTYLGSHEAPWDGATRLPDMRAHLDKHRVPYDEEEGALRYRWNGVECAALMQNNVEHALGGLLGALRPDIVFTAQEGSARLAELASPTTLVAGLLHSVSATGLGVLAGRPHYGLAVSECVRDRAPHTPGTRIGVVYPPFSCPGPATDTARTAAVLMVNPIPAKGSELLHQLIRLMPEQRFTLVEGWWDTSADFAAYPNATYVPRVYGMEPLYRRHQLLLVPSTVEDAFPRVIVEAALHGVPSIGTERGGIPEAIGDEGIVLPVTAGPEAWARAIRDVDHEALGERARSRAARFTRPCLPELRELGI